jgi:hypothetical protein
MPNDGQRLDMGKAPRYEGRFTVLKENCEEQEFRRIVNPPSTGVFSATDPEFAHLVLECRSF